MSTAATGAIALAAAPDTTVERLAGAATRMLRLPMVA